MKHFFSFIVCLVVLKIAHSQTENISPSRDGEYCPNTEYTFTATVPKTYQSMIGVSGATVTQLPTSPVGSTFTFKGKFGDANQKQSFRVYYTDNTYFDFEFKRIKSLFYGTCTCISPLKGWTKMENHFRTL